MAEAAGPAAMRWWGWGADSHSAPLPASALALLGERIGPTGPPRPPVALDAVTLPAPALSETVRDSLAAIVGREHVRSDHPARVLHAAGKGYPDLVRMRSGTPAGAPDAVVYPSRHEQLRELLELCRRASVAVVPFGGGTSVVGGVEPLAGEHAAVLALDLGRMGGVLSLDRESATVTVQAGIRGPALERHLGDRGLTLGHFPQSYEYVSLGGCAATRSAGQASTGYGAIDKLVLGMRLAAPAADIELPPLPASAAGPGLRQLLVGSEGTLGVLGELSLRVRPAPSARAYEGFAFGDFAAGTSALRALAREHLLPDVARLSDRTETQLSLALAGGGVKARVGSAYLGLRGYSDGCLAILGFEGREQDVARRRRGARALLRSAGALALGAAPGRAWLRSRFAGPYLRDELLTQGVMVETLETAAQWSQLPALYAAVERAIADALDTAGTPGIVMCHVSHVYETGASLYYTFLARQDEDDPIAQWRAVKHAASEAIVAGGGTITHHHAVGRDHAPWMLREIGEDGLRALRAVKDELDPTGIMNPGKLLLVSR